MEPIKLSDQLVEDLQKTIVQHDERASDGGIAIQYIAAVLGYMLAQQPFADDQKREFLNQLCEFSKHVFEDCQKNQPAGPESAMGKWRPGDG